jgi:hypothetical protein
VLALFARMCITDGKRPVRSPVFPNIFCCLLIVVALKSRRMHLPDPNTFTFGTAIVNLAIAITAVVRLVLEKNSHRLARRRFTKKIFNWLEQAFQKKLKSVPRETVNYLKIKEVDVIREDLELLALAVLFHDLGHAAF